MFPLLSRSSCLPPSTVHSKRLGSTRKIERPEFSRRLRRFTSDRAEHMIGGHKLLKSQALPVRRNSLNTRRTTPLEPSTLTRSAEVGHAKRLPHAGPLGARCAN